MTETQGQDAKTFAGHDPRPEQALHSATHNIAVLIPCYNEEAAIHDAVTGFKTMLPAARIYVYDNNSQDRTSEIARAAGAIVRNEPLQGKGNVVRRMFSDVEADIYILVDGDNTYEAAAAPRLVEALIDQRLDMITGSRVTDIAKAYRPGHKFGNWMLTSLVAYFFGRRTRDMLSGYRVFSRRFIKSFPALSRGFEIETELTVHALELRMPIADIETVYIDRRPGSESKLSTYRDGLRILRMIVNLVKEERPFQFFAFVSVVLIALAMILFYPILTDFIATGLVPRLPTAVLVATIFLMAVLSFVVGVILDTVTLGRREIKRLHYLSFAAVGRNDRPE
jgi:glycosyltransferase involved in cell wall biosynthesis